MSTKQLLKSMLMTSLLVALCISRASALEYSMEAPEDYLFGKPTSQEVTYQEDEQNVNRSKTAALMPPGFGTPTSYLPGSGEYLTPNLAPGGMDGSLVNSLGSADYTTLPSLDSSAYPSIPGNNFSTSTWTGSGGIWIHGCDAGQLLQGRNAWHRAYSSHWSDG